MRVVKAGLLPTLVLAMFAGSPAQAATCSASLSDISFGNVDPFGGNVDVTGTLNFSCSKEGLGDALDLFILVCFDIGEGSAGNGTINPRRMGDGSGNYMNFNLYSDVTRTLIWGHPSYAFPEVSVVRDYGLLGDSFNDSLTVYGRVFSGQTTVVPGSYSNLFSGAQARVRWTSSTVVPTSCTEGSASFSFSTLATVQAQCSISASDLSFGTQGQLTSAVDATSNIFVTCTNSTAYQVGLDDGLHVSGGNRRMENGGNFVNYELYRDAARTLPWGDSLGVDTQVGTGTGTQQTLTVYGRVPTQTSQPAGTYNDTITVTITY